MNCAGSGIKAPGVKLEGQLEQRLARVPPCPTQEEADGLYGLYLLEGLTSPSGQTQWVAQARTQELTFSREPGLNASGAGHFKPLPLLVS